MSRNKDKGKAFENKIAAFIHKKLYENVKEYHDLFDSLGNTNLRPRREKSSGTTKDCDNDVDMGLGLKFFPFSIECKHNAGVNKISISNILSGKCEFLYKTMKQARRHADSKKLKPLIFFRGNFTENMVMFDVNDIPLVNNGKSRIFFDSFCVMTADDFTQIYFGENNEKVQ
jgi:hypothetical protein